VLTEVVQDLIEMLLDEVLAVLKFSSREGPKLFDRVF